MLTWHGFWFFLFVFGERAMFYYYLIKADWRLIVAMTFWPPSQFLVSLSRPEAVAPSLENFAQLP